jgi:hypothetical protein
MLPHRTGRRHAGLPCPVSAVKLTGFSKDCHGPNAARDTATGAARSDARPDPS